MNTTGLAQSERGNAGASECESESDTKCNAERLDSGKNTAQRRLDADENADTDAISAGNRWEEAIQTHRMNTAVDRSIAEQSTHPRARWQRAILYAQEISGPPDKNSSQGGDGRAIERSSTSAFRNKLREAKARAYHHDLSTGKRKAFNGQEDGQKAVKIKKELEEQHWLEMIDRKHRYGSNLKYYFEEWSLNGETTGNFFRWLDHGEGQNLSLPKCPREKLEAERILYMTRDQRKHYLCVVDRETGKFCWKHPNEIAVRATQASHPLVDTTGQRWTDLGDGQGVAPASAVPPAAYTTEYDYSEDTSSEQSNFDEAASSSSSETPVSIPRPGNLRRTSSTSVEVPEKQRDAKVFKQAKEKGDTWIYVSDADYNLYCGIKQKGRFQHSSFLAGGPITSAGTMIIKDGVLLKCNPMSGHYRTKADYFKRFITQLEKEGADLSNVKIGQTELKLWFIERANTLHNLKGKTRRLQKQMENKLHVSK